MNRMQMLRESWRGWMNQSHPSAGPAWLQNVWTLLFSMVVAAGFTVVGLTLVGTRRVTPGMPGLWETYRAYLVVSVAIGLCIHALFSGVRQIVGVARIRQFGRWQRTLFYSGVPFTGVALGWALGKYLLEAAQWKGSPEYGSGDQGAGGPQAWLGGVALSLLLWSVFQLWFKSRHRELDAERRITEAQLKLLQGQTEPHFRFNILANVLGLIDTDTPRARLMLESFVEYLRASLGSLRQEQRTLGQELDLVEAYLRIVKIRMEDRLRYTVDVPEALRALPLPALTLQPLVENAVTHGLEPQVDGGCMSAAARLDGGVLTLTGSDDGMGLGVGVGVRSARRNLARRIGPGSGTALANIRELLQHHHRGAASLQLETMLPRGTCATLRLPVRAEPVRSSFAQNLQTEPCRPHHAHRTMPTALIADDEPHLAAHLRSQLALLWPELQVLAVARNGVEAVQMIAAHAPDIAFLDIRMPGLTGLEVAQGIEGATRVVFVTAFDEFAVQAFEQAALDYVLKPVTAERLARTVARLHKVLYSVPDGTETPTDDGRLAQTLRRLLAPGSDVPATPSRLRHVRASHGDPTHQIDVADVLFFRADDKYTSVQTAAGEYLIRTPIAELVAQLDPDAFWQVHRSTLVNLRHVAGTRRDELSRLFVRLHGHAGELPVSGAYAHLFKAM